MAGINGEDVKVDISGYEYDSADSLTISANNDQNIITVYYRKRSDLSYTVNYLEKDSNNPVAPVKTVNGKTFEEKVTKAAIDVAGYNKMEPTETTIEIGVSGNEITFYYTRELI